MKTFLKQGQKLAIGYRLSIRNKHIRGQYGERLGTGLGSSLEFQEYKAYQPGDDLRHVDWHIYGKTDRLIVKRFQEELQPKVEVITDISLSMLCPSPEKAQYTLYLAAFLLQCALNSGAICSWWTFGAAHGAAHGSALEQVVPFCLRLPVWPDINFKGRSSLEQGLAGPRFRHNSIRIFISDFLWQADPEKVMRKMLAGATYAVLIIVLTKEELNPSLQGYNTLIDAESGEKRSLLINKEALATYKKNLNRHLGLWKEMSIKQGAICCQILVSDIKARNLVTLLQHQIVEKVK